MLYEVLDTKAKRVVSFRFSEETVEILDEAKEVFGHRYRSVSRGKIAEVAVLLGLRRMIENEHTNRESPGLASLYTQLDRRIGRMNLQEHP